MANSKLRPGSGSGSAIRMTGRFWLLRWRFAVQSGQKTPTSSDGGGVRAAGARERVGQRDPDDWPILAAALALRCPIWTEDTDFFGCGVATWTSNRVRVFLRRSEERRLG